MAEEPCDWFFHVEPEVYENLSRIIRSQDAILLGRGTYDYWVGYWPTSDVEPFAGFINGTQKHVFSSAPPAEQWPNSTFVPSPAVDYVAKLKQTPVHPSYPWGPRIIRPCRSSGGVRSRGDVMAKVVVIHGVEDMDRWLGFKAERAEAIGALGGTNVVDHVAQDGSDTVAVSLEVDDVAGLLAALASPPPELLALMDSHGVIPPLTSYVEG